MKIHHILCVWVLFSTSVVKGQNTFHNIYLFEDSFSVIQNVYPTDSCYYFSALEVNNTSNRYEALFGTLKLDGEVDWYVRNQDPSSKQAVSGSRTELIQNTEGNFTMGFRNNLTFRLLTYSPDGTVILDTVYWDLYDVDSLKFSDFGRIITTQDAYYAFFTYYDLLNDLNWDQGEGEVGVLLAKIDYQGNIMWKRRFRNPTSTPFKSGFSTIAGIQISDTSLLLNVQETSRGVPIESDKWGKIHFYEVDTAGNILSHNERQDTQHNYGWGGMLKTENSLLYSNFLSEYVPIPGGSQFKWGYRPVITCVDSNYNLIWTDTLINRFTEIESYFVPRKYIQNSDTSFSAASSFFYLYINEDTSYFYSLFNIKLFNKDLRTGKDIWARHYRYFPEDSMRRYEHEILDIEHTFDDGYIMSGTVISYDSLQQGKPFRYGYVIKTNCLGFLGDPQAAVNYTVLENYNVRFANQSIQAGSYLWDFGDGTQLLTGENADSVFHAYANEGLYTVQLIAFGCDGRNDTLNFVIDVELIQSGFQGDGTLLTVFPNPATTGSSVGFYVGDIPEGNATIRVHSALGEIVDEFSISQANTNYLFLCDYAAGMYFFSLEQNGKRLELEKLVVY